MSAEFLWWLRGALVRSCHAGQRSTSSGVRLSFDAEAAWLGSQD